MKKKKKQKEKTIQKNITKQNLQDALHYDNDTRLDNLDDLETVDYNNDTLITDSIPKKEEHDK